MSDAHDEAMTPEEARLLAELGQALGPDTPPPGGFIARAEALVAFADLDRQLAGLLDQAAGELAGARGPATTAGTMRFEVADGSVAVELLVDRGRLTGQVIAGTITEVGLEAVSGPVGSTAVDEFGRFAFEHPGTGPVRLRLRGVPSGSVATGWFLP